jgi:ubiquinone/menaquinone biosynthesis C-methylase UbiE
MTEERLGTYIIRGGKEGADRLGVLARAVRPTTLQLLDRAGELRGTVVVDVGCGAGEVTFDLAERVGAGGKVFGLDLDETKLALAREEAAKRGLTHVVFHKCDVGDPWPADGVSLVYMRFIITHLSDPALALRRAREALLPGRPILIEDVDIEGHFCDPPSSAFDRGMALYVEASRRRGCDPFIGRRLLRHLEEAGFEDVGTALFQPFGREGDAKRMAALTFTAIAGGLVAGGLAGQAEVDGIARELDAFTARPDTTISMPRVFQAWGMAPAHRSE